MGLESGSDGMFLKIFEGQIVREVKEPIEGETKSRVNKQGKTVHYLTWKAVSGVITSIKKHIHPEFGTSINIGLKDGSEYFTLSIQQNSRPGGTFLKTLPNIDLKEPVRFNPTVKTENNKQVTTLFIQQDGTALRQAYSRDQPNGLPPMREMTIRGEKVWDDTDQINFLWAMVERDIIPKLPKQSDGSSATSTPAARPGSGSSQPGATKQPAAAPADQGFIDDLPF